MTVKNLHEDALYTQLKTDEIYSYFRQGQGKNLSAASDVARYQIMHKHGGVYLDTDDIIQANVDSAALMAGPNDVLLGNAVVHRATGYKPFYNTSNFATQPGNPLMKDILTEMHKRFTANKPYFVNNRPVARQSIDGGAFTADLDTYAKKLFETTGPTLLNDTLKVKRPDMYDLGLEGLAKDTKVVDGELVSSGPVVNNEERARNLYLKEGIAPPPLLRSQINKMSEHYFPLRHKFNVKPGADHSWKTG
ncbi:6-phosphofructokinase [Pseudomonas sp. R5-89-07]|nr:6-phosphofructokinase [Pseudomonas sp. R5-89-07]